MSLAKQHHIQTPTEDLLRLAKTLDDLMRFRVFGGALAECYGDITGAKTWGRFVRISDPKIQYTNPSEVNNIDINGEDIARLIVSDPDLDTENLIVIDKGKGSRESALAKSIKLLKKIVSQGGNIALCSEWEASSTYRKENEALLVDEFPDTKVSSFDVDFNKDDPDISTKDYKNVDRPRLVMEFGSSRGNIATVANDGKKLFAEQAYEELQARFANDYKNCREGGILVIGSDANQEDSALDAYIHPSHSKFAENIVHRGKNEGALSDEFNPQLLYYDPQLETHETTYGYKFNVIKHNLVASEKQTFGILQSRGDFKYALIEENDCLTLSHSIKWSQEAMIAAAESQGFKCLSVKWNKDKRVPIYVFKAMPKTPRLATSKGQNLKAVYVS